jgi:DUF1680 family protein
MRKRIPAIAAIFVFSQVAILLLLHGKSPVVDNPAKTSEQRILKARPLPLNSVRLTGGPLKVAQDLDAKYLLELEPDRMLSFLRQRAGLQPKAEPYGGWDGAGRQLTGHIAGHYLSAVSLMWAATGDVRFKERADYIVKELKEVQDKQGDGYIGALMDAQGVDGKVHFEELSKGIIRSGGFDLNGLWSPWYVEHKIFAGLRDAYRYTSNRTALDVEIKFAAWAEHILAPLNDDQIQKMLATEFGGMNEVTAELYEDTGDSRWMKLSDKFEHRAVVDPLAAHEDILAHKHGNALVPKLYGDLERYILTGNETDGRAAEYFWEAVALHHSFATGGHGKNEYFGPADELNDMIDGRTAESCNVYNMLKFTRELFCVNPDVRYADFHERALFNHVLGSQDPGDGRVCYMVPVGRGVQHEYQRPFQDFTCCVGTGMESHALHGYGLYYESADKLWVNIYAPTKATWATEGVELEMTTGLPEGESASLKLTPKSPREFTVALRRPYWAGKGFTVKVNGKPVENLPAPDSYVEIKRKWKSGDTVQLVLPKTLREERLPDNPNRTALMWGELVLAGDLGPEITRGQRGQGQSPPAPLPPAPVFVTSEKSVNAWLKPVSGKPGTFQTAGVGLTKEVEFVPFYRLPERRYAIYWDTFTPQEWQQKSEALAAEQENQRKLEASTVSFVQPGQPQSEHDFNQQGEDTSPVQIPGHPGRRGTKWFSFDLPVDPSHSLALVVTYSNDARSNSTFDVVVDGKKVGEQTGVRRSPEIDAKFFDATYALPVDLVSGKQKVTVRFDANGGGEISSVYGIRIVRTDAPR